MNREIVVLVLNFLSYVVNIEFGLFCFFISVMGRYDCSGWS